MANLSRAIGRNQTYIQQFLDPKKGSPRILSQEVREALAPHLGVDPDDLRESVNRQIYPKTNVNLHVPRENGKVATGNAEEKLKVLGMVECGPDGWSLWNGDVIDRIPRPANLAGAPKAYAVYVVGDSMEPRYYAGELLFVHPGRPVSIGSFVLVQIRPDEGEAAPRAIVKRLARRSPTKLVLEQFNPPKKFDIQTEDIVSVHVVVGTSLG